MGNLFIFHKKDVLPPRVNEGGFFMSLFFNQNEDYYSLTNAGIALFIIIVAVLIILTAVLKNKEKSADVQNPKLFSTKQLVFSAVAIALGFICSYLKPIDMPWGGSVTLCSMLFITLIGYWYGLKIGLSAAFAYAIMQFLQGGGGYILSPLQVCMDYFFAFTALGLSGLFHKQKHGLIKGYIFAIFMRGLFHTIGGYLYWMDYMPENFPQSLAFLYPIAYNYAYILLEGFITVVLLVLPPVQNAMARVKRLACE